MLTTSPVISISQSGGHRSVMSNETDLDSTSGGRGSTSIQEGN